MKTSRGSFLRGAGLAALGALGWATLFRSRTPGEPNKTPPSRCERCRVLSMCSRPDALQVRDALGMEPDRNRPDRIDGTERLCLGSAPKRLPSDTGS